MESTLLRLHMIGGPETKIDSRSSHFDTVKFLSNLTLASTVTISAWRYLNKGTAAYAYSSKYEQCNTRSSPHITSLCIHYHGPTTARSGQVQVTSIPKAILRGVGKSSGAILSEIKANRSPCRAAKTALM